MSRVSRPIGFAVAAMVVVATSSCVSPTGSDTTLALVSVRGTWSYVSTQTGSADATTGTLTLSQDSTVRFSGTLDATESDERGQLRHVLAVVSGRTLDATLVDFDLAVDPTVVRRHTGSVRGDSLTGNWFELSDAGVSAAGTFRARRIRTP
jgi:predicted RNase H-like nuclease